RREPARFRAALAAPVTPATLAIPVILETLVVPGPQSDRERRALRWDLKVQRFLVLLVSRVVRPASDSCCRCPIPQGCRWRSTVCIAPLPPQGQANRDRPR